MLLCILAHDNDLKPIKNLKWLDYVEKSQETAYITGILLSIFVFIVSTARSHGYTVIFFAEIAEVMYPDKFLSARSHDVDVELLCKEEVDKSERSVAYYCRK